MICYLGNTLNLFPWFCPLATLRNSFSSTLSVGCRMNTFKRKICSRMGFVSLPELPFTSGPSWGCFFRALVACVSGACLPLVCKPLTPQLWSLWEQSIGSFRWNEGEESEFTYSVIGEKKKHLYENCLLLPRAMDTDDI